MCPRGHTLNTAKQDPNRLLSPRECLAIRDELLDLQNLWICRKPRCPTTGKSLGYRYYTVFGASYLDAKKTERSIRNYEKAAARFNPILKGRLGWVYRKVFARLETLLGGSIRPAPGFALPGFHIYREEDGVFGLDGTPHFDTQFRPLNWDRVSGCSLAEVATFTLPLVLPKGGAGVECWDFSYERSILEGEKSVTALLRGTKKTVFHHRAGRLFLMRGLLAHRILDVREFDPGDMRITLQGHAVRAKGGWAVYW